MIFPKGLPGVLSWRHSSTAHPRWKSWGLRSWQEFVALSHLQIKCKHVYLCTSILIVIVNSKQCTIYCLYLLTFTPEITQEFSPHGWAGLVTRLPPRPLAVKHGHLDVHGSWRDISVLAACQWSLMIPEPWPWYDRSISMTFGVSILRPNGHGKSKPLRLIPAILT